MLVTVNLATPQHLVVKILALTEVAVMQWMVAMSLVTVPRVGQERTALR